MNQIILGTLANVLRAYSIYRFLKLFFQLKNDWRLIQKAVYIVFILLTSGGYYLFHNMLINIVTNSVGLFLIVNVYKGGILKKCFGVASIYSINVVIESLIFAFIGFYGNQRNEYESICEGITSIGILLFIIILDKTKALGNKEIQISLKVWLALLGVPIISIAMILLLIGGSVSERDVTEIQIISILLINLFIFYLFGTIQDYYKDKEEKHIFYQQMLLYSNELDIMKESYENVRELRHDMKHHISELRYLINNGEKDFLLKYIDEMQKHMLNESEYASSGNKDIDGTLNYLLSKTKGTLFKADVNIVIPKNLELHNYKFNVILGNLLENAIYAAAKSEKKYVKIEIKTKQNILYLEIKNSYEGNIEVKNNRFISNKQNAEKHGIGLQSVKKLIDEMNGRMEVKWNEHEFTVNVLLYLGCIVEIV